MTELREEIDRIDREISMKLRERADYIDRAAEIKSEQDLPARIEERVEEVAMNARKNAEAVRLDPDLAEKLWRELIEWSIAREEKEIGA